MKTNGFPLNCIVASIADAAGRRFLKFTPLAKQAGPAAIPVKRHRTSFRLRPTITPEVAFSFEPAIQVRPLAKT